ncbi:MAG: hypothetical protein UX79_C0009G0007 [candidate division WWE3 bacterium GW2011_GWB1_47_11]|uniref:Uncharacterized protein n=2 Tax=Katanobacteria TaxID=422282 RepID=A0A0G1RKD2_UNCKA|nr:MAG: hypothetical protein UX73_C0025G0005 [candidate division WWE3 bacterium GW2011_GWC1_47_10]KKU57542.1 MAG: hypothetical protein UX79_C0009G0007 [candidate division WWE3 bacterium GW2011_GWB1_47_11]
MDNMPTSEATSVEVNEPAIIKNPEARPSGERPEARIEFGDHAEAESLAVVEEAKSLAALIGHAETVGRLLNLTSIELQKNVRSPELLARANEMRTKGFAAMREIYEDFKERLLGIVTENLEPMGEGFLGETYQYYKTLEGGLPIEGIIPAEVLTALAKQYDPNNPERVLYVGNFLVVPPRHSQLHAAIGRVIQQKADAQQIARSFEAGGGMAKSPEMLTEAQMSVSRYGDGEKIRWYLSTEYTSGGSQSFDALKQTYLEMEEAKRLGDAAKAQRLEGLMMSTGWIIMNGLKSSLSESDRLKFRDITANDLFGIVSEEIRLESEEAGQIRV